MHSFCLASKINPVLHMHLNVPTMLTQEPPNWHGALGSLHSLMSENKTLIKSVNTYFIVFKQKIKIKCLFIHMFFLLDYIWNVIRIKYIWELIQNKKINRTLADSLRPEEFLKFCFSEVIYLYWFTKKFGYSDLVAPGK